MALGLAWVVTCALILSRMYLATSWKVATQALLSWDLMYVKYSSSADLGRGSQPIPSTPWKTSTSHTLSRAAALSTQSCMVFMEVPVRGPRCQRTYSLLDCAGSLVLERSRSSTYGSVMALRASG